jgi:hypothetical protein
MATERFPIRVGRRSAAALRLGFGVRPANAWVELGDEPGGEVRVSFGWTGFRTPLTNVVRWQLEGPWTWIKAIGVRVSILGDHDVSFDGSAHGGVRIDLRTPVRWFLFRVPAIYASVDDLDAIAAALTARGIPGEDVRRRR